MNNHIAKSTAIYTRRFMVNDPYFPESPPENLSLIVVIPAYKEPDISPTLKSLSQCIAPQGTVEIIVVINASENAVEEDLIANQKTINQIKAWEDTISSESFSIKVIREEKLPEKFAGAGLARKIGMDEALRRWALRGIDGVILCLDADCVVSEDYLIAAEKAFSDHKVQLGHYQFEHLFKEEEDVLLKNGIIQYELHLRYHFQGLKWAGYPFAIHTVGSCMGVRASTYARSGGMNRRKAGEDFYFMHKLLPVSGFVYLPAVVYPSCRSSDRVPFGTGRAQLEFLANGAIVRNTYHPDTYVILKQFFCQVETLYTVDNFLGLIPHELYGFLQKQNFNARVTEIRSKSKSKEVFLKNFWQWMDGFMVLKMTHYLRDLNFPETPVTSAANTLIAFLFNQPSALDLSDLLLKYRQFDLNYFSRGVTSTDT